VSQRRAGLAGGRRRRGGGSGSGSGTALKKKKMEEEGAGRCGAARRSAALKLEGERK